MTTSTDFTTSDPELAHAFLQEVYAENTMRITGSQEGFRLRHSHRELGDRLIVTAVTHTMSVEHSVQPLGRLLVGRVRDGKLERETAGESIRAGSGDVFLVASPDRPYDARWDLLDVTLVSVAQSVLDDVVPDRQGVPGRFTSFQPVSAEAGRRCAKVIDFVTGDLLADESASPLLVDHAARLLGAALLTTFPNTYVETDQPAGAAASPAALRRALEFVHTNAHQPIGVTELAEHAHVTARALQLAFRRHLDTTPTEYLRMVRLDRAHQELFAADPARGHTVTAIAMRWGFHHQGRFAALYRRVYGCSPRQTLHS